MLSRLCSFDCLTLLSHYLIHLSSIEATGKEAMPFPGVLTKGWSTKKRPLVGVYGICTVRVRYQFNPTHNTITIACPNPSSNTNLY